MERKLEKEFAAMDYDSNNSSKLLDVPNTVSNSILSFKPCDFERRRVTIMDLPKVIMVEIISRLPIKSIFCCKCVCKYWYSIPSDPLFVNMHHTRSSRFPCLLLSIDDSVTSILELKARYDYDSDPQNRPFMLFPTAYNFGLGFVKPKLKLIGSCNGIFCLSNAKMHARDHSVYISNPLLGEYFKLQLPQLVIGVRPVTYEFCFSEASGQYKLLRFVTRRIQGGPRITELEVYTLGVDKNWRNVGEAPHPLLGSFGNVYVSGFLHWMDGKDLGNGASIYSFDIEKEKVKSLAPPPCVTTKYSNFLVELRNFLCLIDNVFTHGFFYVDIWRMKEYGISKSWTKCNHIILTGFLLTDLFSYAYKPIIIWKDGEILMQSGSGKKLASYNLNEKQFRKVRVYGDGRVAARYIPSFYSLKTVIGNNYQVLNVYPKTKII